MMSAESALQPRWLRPAAADPVFDPLHPGFRRDPYPVYHRFRHKEPVHIGPPPGPSFPASVYLFRYDDVRRLLTEDRFRRRPHGRERKGERLGTGRLLLPDTGERITRVRSSAVLFKDPPAHTRVRTLVGRAFAPVAREAVSRIERIAHELLDAVEGRDTFDLIGAFTALLPVYVIADAMGIPREDCAALKRWSARLIALLDIHDDGDATAVAKTATAELSRYLEALIELRRARPGADLISRLLAVEQEGERLSAAEVLSNCILLLGAGYETTICVLGTAIHALLERPVQLRRLREHPALLPLAVEEFVRYDSPVQMVFRVSAEACMVRGVEISAGTPVLGVVGSANRDPLVFADPDTLDLSRSPNRHLGFGHGRHACLGSQLARQEVQHALRVLLERMPTLRLADAGPERLDTILFRGLKSLRVQR